MILAIQNFKAKRSNMNLVSNPLRCSINSSVIEDTKNLPSDNFTSSKKISKINFTGYLGVDGYGTQEDRDALNYKVKLTPEKIAENIQNAKSIDEGISTSWIELAEESKHINKAIESFSNVNADYNKILNQRCKEIKRQIPKHSRKPYIGIVVQIYHETTGTFINEIGEDVWNLFEDFMQIEKKYYTNTHTMICDHIKATQALREAVMASIEYLGDTPSKTDKLNKLLEAPKKVIETDQKTFASIEKSAEKVCDKLDTVFVNQQGKQLFRMWRKMVTFMIGGI